MEIRCPKCEQVIHAHDINRDADFFVCGKCDEAYRISELSHEEKAFDIEDPPRGVYFKKTGTGFAIYASSRSIAGAILCLALAALFTFFLVYVLYAISPDEKFISYASAILSLPCIFFCLYGVLIFTRGRVIITVEGDTGTLFRGIGRWGKTEHFRWSGVIDVRYELMGKGRAARRFFIIDGDPGMVFSPQLNMEQVDYIKSAMRAMLKKRNSEEYNKESS